MKAKSIITLNQSDVKNEAGAARKISRHSRFIRKDISASCIRPEVKAFAKHMKKMSRKKQAVRIPAMSSDMLGQLLRSLEIRRACK